MSELFVLASRKKFRFPSVQGPLTAEQLWDFPLQTISANKVSLDNIAKDINADLKSSAEESFVETASNPAQAELQAKLDLVKYVIQIKVADNKAALERSQKMARRSQILDVLATKEAEALTNKSREDLLKELKDLET